MPLTPTGKKNLKRIAAVIVAAPGVALLWAAGNELFTFAGVARRNPLIYTFSLLPIVLIAGGLFFMTYTLWTMEGVSSRLLFLGSYCLSVFLFLGFLMPMGDEAVAALLLISYGPVTIIALIFPLRHCTILKGVTLAGIGVLLSFVLGLGLDLFARLIPGA